MTKFFIRQPGTLENFAIRKFGYWIALQADKLMLTPNMPEDLLSTHIEGIQLLIYKVPYMIHDKVASDALKSLTELMAKHLIGPQFSRGYPRLYSEIEARRINDIIKRVTETLCTENLTSLKLGDNQIHLFESYILTGLTNLQINCSYCKEVDVIKFLKQLPNLKSFEYWNSCTEKGLQCLIENCKLLEELNLFYTKRINNKSIHLITQLPNLKSVKLRQTSVTERGVVTLLKACQKVEELEVMTGTLQEACITNALKKIASSKPVKIQLKLKLFYEGHNPTVEELYIIASICPFIEEIAIYKSNANDYAKPFNNFQNLRNLRLYNLDFYKDPIKQQLLEVTNLVELQLSKVEIDLNALAYISQTCPNLKSLNINFITPSAFDCFNTPVATLLPFKNVTNLVINGDPHDDELTFILSNCPNIECITFAHQNVLTDDVMTRVLEKNPLRCLKELYIHKSKLTRSVLDRIVRNSASLEMTVRAQLVKV